MNAIATATDMSGLAVADAGPNLGEELVSFAAPGSAEADRYRILRQAVERFGRDTGARVFAVTSPGPGEGKTLTTLNLAGSLARAPEARLLVVDADLHRPSVARYLGLALSGAPGLTEALLYEDLTLARTARRIDSLGISILHAGRTRRVPYELLASPRFEGLVGDMRRLYDYVLIDTPPVVPIADCQLLARWVDAFLVVVAAHRTPRRALAEALSVLGPKVLGIVFNRDDRPLGKYYGYDSYTNPRAAR
ncbi:MAG TPA: CpsD/CapB family tyrosine-protein kinase [Vicinamibacterales bacterium]|nr:CpsD/CapB family tyrosine-protein kinase [Vicinamibacterales bacterium]